jgi:uncharacterized OsmC-like protein
MPIVFGCDATSVEEIVSQFRQHGDRIAGTYRARYTWNAQRALYTPAALERPESLRDNPPDVVYPWEQLYLAAATCAGSDYPMLAHELAVPLASVEFVVSGVFDPRHEFSGLRGFTSPQRHCYLGLHLKATLESTGARDQLEAIHRRVVEHNMALDGLRGIPRTDELVII